MYKAKHTPGPWYGSKSPSSVVGFPIISKTGRSITNISIAPKSMPGAEIFNAESVENARLIAAAPDLLDALVAAEKAFGDDCEDGGFCPVTVKMRAAIAKTKEPT